jgi:2-polyprenyl-3-methyl-5-hydroxy-6-metoxy-1,4-benzoquinol methylase
MREFWDNRYNQQEYVYGTNPNAFLKKSLDQINMKGKILFPGEGEGRNAVYAATEGWEVSAFDYSKSAKDKALKLASENNVIINYAISDISDTDYVEGYFDAIVLIFAHFPPGLRNPYHKHLLKFLKKDGIIILEGFSKEHIAFQKSNPWAGGPKNLEMLFSSEEIENDFKGCDILLLKEEIIQLNEGAYHKGKASVIRFIGKKQ